MLDWYRNLSVYQNFLYHEFKNSSSTKAQAVNTNEYDLDQHRPRISFEGKIDDASDEDLSPENPISYEILPSALNSPKFLSEVGSGFIYSLNNAKTYTFNTLFGRLGVPFFLASLLRRLEL